MTLEERDERMLTREERLRRVVLICTYFIRNLAYYRGARESPSGWKDVPLGVGMSAAEWDAYLMQMRRYRDKFVAHLDDDRTMNLPVLDSARAAVELYHAHVIDVAPRGSLAGLVQDGRILAAGYEEEKARAARIFRTARSAQAT